MLAQSSQLRHGVWLSSEHDDAYGPMFKARQIHGYGGSAKLMKLLNAAASPELDVYQFGVYTGGSMKALARKIRSFGHLYGFDSFTGLPEEKMGMKMEGPHWKPGGFSAADALQDWTLPTLLSKIKQHIGMVENVTLIPGYFEQSLKPELARSFAFRPALLVDIDVDLYSSTMSCLSWLFEQRILRPGSYVRYDDWRSILQMHGEGRAHREASLRYNVTWRNLGGGYAKGAGSMNSREWQVVSIGPRRSAPWQPGELESAMRSMASPEGLWRRIVRP